MTTTIAIGDRVEAGQGVDRDRGTVDRIDGDMAVVRWDSLVVTTCPIDDLRKIGSGPTTEYTVRRYSDGQEVGSVQLTPEQFDRYERLADGPEGLVRLGSLPHDLYDLDPEWQDLHEDTTVWLD